MQAPPDAVLLYDGLCGFCDSTVQFMLSRDKTCTMRFATLQGAYAERFFVRYPALRRIDSVILVQAADTETETVHVLSSASVQLCYYLGGIWRVAGVVLNVVPRILRDAGYRLFARFRYSVFGRLEACRIPDPAQQARFLD